MSKQNLQRIAHFKPSSKQTMCETVRYDLSLSYFSFFIFKLFFKRNVLFITIAVNLEDAHNYLKAQCLNLTTLNIVTEDVNSLGNLVSKLLFKSQFMYQVYRQYE